MSSSQTFSVNERAAELVERVKAAAAELKVAVARGELGETLIDAGSRSRGGIAAGLRLAEICMGGLGTVDARLHARDATLALDVGGTLVQSRHRLPRQPICGLAAFRRATARTPSSRSAPVRRAHSRGANRCSNSSLTRTGPRPRDPCAGKQPSAPVRARRQGRA